nr:MAG: putative viral replication protein [Ulva CRESS virus 5]
MHKDGTPHIHFFIKSRKKIGVYGNKVGKFVANWKAVWDEAGWQKYISKDTGEKLTNFEGGLLGASNVKELHERARKMQGEWAAAVHLQSLKSSWDMINKKGIEFVPKYAIEDFRVPAEITKWLTRLDGDRFEILVIAGPTRQGKTAMVRTLAAANGLKQGYCKERVNQKAWLKDIDVMILDDLLPGEPGGVEKPPAKAWTARDEFVITAKYMAKTTVRSVPVIIVTNDAPVWLELPYWKVNAKYVNLTGVRLF